MSPYRTDWLLEWEERPQVFSQRRANESLFFATQKRRRDCSPRRF